MSARRRAGGVLAMLALVVGAVFVVGGPANAQTRSPGCVEVEEAVDNATASSVLFEGDFFAGETITGTATPVENGAEQPDSVFVAVNFIQVDTTDFPGTVSYTFPTDTDDDVAFFVDQGTAVWTFSCDPAPEDGDDGDGDVENNNTSSSDSTATNDNENTSENTNENTSGSSGESTSGSESTSEADACVLLCGVDLLSGL